MTTQNQSTLSGAWLHARAHALFDDTQQHAAQLRAGVAHVGGATVLDAGVQQLGSLEAGRILARLCLADQATVGLVPAPAEMVSDNAVLVHTDRPVHACLGGQYAGWPVSLDRFFAMASGPMRMLRGREEILTELQLHTPASPADFAVGVLEADRLPGEDVVTEIASDCDVPADRVCLAVAPVTSIAGSVQVVSRSIETALHKLHALDFDVTAVASATGIAPVPPPAAPGDTVGGIGRTNDAMLYGAKVTLWIDAEDDLIEAVATKIPSETSADYGQPFAQIFKHYDYDFYKVDPMLFSPAVLTVHSLRSGRSWRAGKLAPEILRASFGIVS